METNVGTLRQQTAFSASDRPVIVISANGKVPHLKVIEFFPDSTDQEGRFVDKGTFKIVVDLA